MAQTDSRHLVGELSCGVAAGISLYQWGCSWFYRAAAVWLGLLSFLFFAAISSWITFAIAMVAGAHVNFHRMVEWLFGIAILAGVYGVFNAAWTRTHANHSAASELAGCVEGKKSGADQRFAPWARAQW